MLSFTNNVRDFVFLSALLCDELFTPELRTPFVGCFSVHVRAVGSAAPAQRHPAESEVGRVGALTSAGSSVTPSKVTHTKNYR